MKQPFETDLYPGKPKILFIGLANSTHTHAWIDLLSNAEFNVRLFAMPGSLPPPDWQVKTYVSGFYTGRNNGIRQYLYKKPGGILESIYYMIAKRIGRLPISPDTWLVNVIKKWKPDIIHTLGLFDGQGGLFYHQARQKFQLEHNGKWVLQLRGGSDLALNRHDAKLRPKIFEALQTCDRLLSDNPFNYRYAEELGVNLSGKLAEFATVPGTGGIDVRKLRNSWQEKPSLRHIIVFPKAYELPWSKALPVFEAIKIAWERMTPCTIHMLNATPEIQQWYNTLPESFRNNWHLHDRMSRQEFLLLLSQARVLLIPSLVDGVPNSMYEAMALGAFPIVSPLETILSVVENEKNVLFARNLYPHEIAEALVRAINDDQLVDTAAQRNVELVERIADRENIRPKIISYYENLAKEC
jgi:hypothetical protein